MYLQCPNLKLGILVGIVVFSFAVGTKVQADNYPQIRARVVHADGTPLANADVYTMVLHRDFDARGGRLSRQSKQTDTAGYFVADLHGDEHKFYMLGVAYQGYLAKTPPFILHAGQPEVHLLLTLNDNRVPLDRWEPDQVFRILEIFFEPPTVWVVNPTNGHGYKRIYCLDIMDAMTQAAAENAYLVSMNNKAEETWILGVFDPDSFWIGLNDVEEEGQWVWASGEPVTYTNWRPHQKEGGNTEEKDYVISGWGDEWEAVAAGDRQPHYFHNEAIIEKVDLPVKQMWNSLEQGVWAINPENGHAYIKMPCENLDEAKDRAAAQGAHLVTINDKAEQDWLLGLFGNRFFQRNRLYWIGLSDAEKEGEWVWQNGEPLTYSNWGDKHGFPRSNLSPEEKDATVMTFMNGQWYAVGPGDLFWDITKWAIIEKPNVFDNSLLGEE